MTWPGAAIANIILAYTSAPKLSRVSFCHGEFCFIVTLTWGQQMSVPSGARGVGKDSSLDELLKQLAAMLVRPLAAELATQLRAANDDMVPQAGSPLGNRRHCAAVKRRVARGEPGAAVVGKKHLLSREALDEELHGVSRGPVKAATSVDELEDVGQRLRRKLGRA